MNSREPMGDAILVTGAGSGLGLETSLLLAERGFRVYATTHLPEEGPVVLEAARKSGVGLTTLPLDVTDRESIESAVSRIEDEAGAIYGLVNNAGRDLRGCFEDVTEEEFRRVYEINVFGTMAVTRRVLPTMRLARRGRIVTITSIAGRIASFGMTGYCSTKFALEGFCEALALDLAPFGLKVVIVEPGIVNTPIWSTHRGTAKNAFEHLSPYREMFRRHEEEADRLVIATRTKSVQVAETVYEALTTPKPRLRYVVGPLAKIMLTLRRYLPGETFERIYFGKVMHRVVGGPPSRHHLAAPGVYPRVDLG